MNRKERRAHLQPKKEIKGTHVKDLRFFKELTFIKLIRFKIIDAESLQISGKFMYTCFGNRDANSLGVDDVIEILDNILKTYCGKNSTYKERNEMVLLLVEVIFRAEGRGNELDIMYLKSIKHKNALSQEQKNQLVQGADNTRVIK